MALRHGSFDTSQLEPTDLGLDCDPSPLYRRMP